MIFSNFQFHIFGTPLRLKCKVESLERVSIQLFCINLVPRAHELHSSHPLTVKLVGSSTRLILCHVNGDPVKHKCMGSTKIRWYALLHCS